MSSSPQLQDTRVAASPQEKFDMDRLVWDQDYRHYVMAELAKERQNKKPH
ncbi:hypothetical protein ACTL6U_01110 [Rhodovibrionaceae bacterium A322]